MGRAIVRDPQVFLFDEPLSNLDAKLRVQMRSEIRDLHQRLGTTCVYVTHDQVEAMTMADRIVVMHQGRIEQIGAPLELYDRPANLFVAGFIGSPSMNFIQGAIRRNGAGAVVETDGGFALPLPPDAEGEDGRPVVYGVRPEHLSLGGGDDAIPARIKHVEPTGADTFVFADVAGTQVCSVSANRARPAAGSIVRLQPQVPAVHLFDAASGRTLRSAPPLH
jgi:multiple sugar transport system ATP-binding protein